VLPILLLGLGVGTVIGLLMGLAYLQAWKIRYTKSVREDAVSRSQAVTVGKVFEQLVPHLPEFDFNPKDARFIGSPVDFVVFDGLNDGEVRSVVFVEVKTGRADLSTRERRVKDAVKAGRVEWSEVRVAAAGSLR
jgi:predicted Holliday junction resolvase-like endonuclease